MTDAMAGLTAALADRYHLDGELGAGGMATVYLARDLRHDRRVAVKVLKPELVAVIGAERFLAEIRTTANLQHPHILALHDSGSARAPDGSGPFLYYVMPYIEGESLRDRLAREKQLPVEDAVRIAGEVLSALDYAHRHGVVHRDIKPENILLHDGQALVADFGIALAVSSAGGGTRMTETGMSLGTPHYMSPEQAMGEREITPRSDVYALGCVLYEILVGEPPFTGPSPQAIIARVVTEEPRSLTLQRRTIPPHVETAVRKALEKLPADRFSTAADFAAALRDSRFPPAATPAAPRAAAARPRWLAWRVGASGMAVLLAGAALGRALGRESVPPPLVARLVIPVEASQGLASAPVNTLALSPDGRVIIYVGRAQGSGLQLYLRRLDGLTAHPILGTLGAAFPIFSPDGNRVAYFAPGGMYLIALTGGAATPVPNVQAQALAQAVWLDDQAFVATAADGALVRVGLNGVVTTIARPDSTSGERYLGANAVLPDRRTVLAIAATGGVNGTLVAIDTRTGSRTRLLDAVTNAAWYADGCLLWAQPNGALLGAPFDPSGPRITGAPVTLAEGVRQAVGGSAQVAVSATGSMVYIPEHPFNLMLLDRGGRREVVAEGRRFHSPRFSPDGRRLAVDFTYQGSRDVWTLDLSQRTLSRMSFENDGHDPVWLPDGRSVAYVSRNGIYQRRADGSGVAESLHVGAVLTSVLTFARDGRHAITAPTGTNGSFDLGLLALGEQRVERAFLATPFNEQAAALSPDGRWLAYGSDETGREEVYVRPFPEGGAKVLVSQNGGHEPVWSPDGRALFYIGDQGGAPSLMAAAVAAGAEFAVLGRTPLFEVTEFEPAAPHANYDISPDGARFAMVHQGPLSEMVLMLNWTAEVRRQSTRVAR